MGGAGTSGRYQGDSVGGRTCCLWYCSLRGTVSVSTDRSLHHRAYAHLRKVGIGVQILLYPRVRTAQEALMLRGAQTEDAALMLRGAQTEDAAGEGHGASGQRRDARSRPEQVRPRPRGQHLSVYFRPVVKEAPSAKGTFRPRWAAGRSPLCGSQGGE